MSREIHWNWSLKPGHSSFNDPEYERQNPYHPAPPLTAFGNIQYLEMIALIKLWWEGVHPEVEFEGVQDTERFQPDHAYMIYTLLDRRADDRTPKPKLHNEVFDTESGEVIIVSTMSFVNIVQFTAVHRDPQTTDQIIEEFEEFMLLEATPNLMRLGIEEIRFGNRMRDGTMEMDGNDLCTRNLTFRITTQKVLWSTIGRLEELYVKAVTHMYSELDATPSIPGIIEMVRRATDPEED